MKKNIFIVSCMQQEAPSGVVTYYNQIINYIPGINFSLCTPQQAHFFHKKSAGLFNRILSYIRNDNVKAYCHIKIYEFLLVSALKKFKRRNAIPEILHAQDNIAVIASRKVFPTTKIILTAHYNDSPFHEYSLLFKLSEMGKIRINKYFRLSYSYIDILIGVSKYSIERSAFLMPKAIDTIIIHNAVNIETIREKRHEKIKNKFIISNIGYLEPRKNQIALLQLAINLKAGGINNFEVWIIGKGPKYNDYNKFVHDNNLTDHVKLHGYIRNPWEIVSESHLYIHTSLNDNCPYSVIEALAAGVYVIAFPYGGIKELLPPEFVLSDENIEDLLLKTVVELYQQNLKENLIQHIALERYSITNWITNMTKVYN